MIEQTMSAYDFLAPARIAFGWGRRAEAGRFAASIGRRAFLISGSRTLEKDGVLDEIQHSLSEQNVETVQMATVSREPEVEDVDRTVAELLRRKPGGGDLLLAVGGGSAIDLAKAAAAMATNCQGNSVADFLEGVGRGLKIEAPPLPLMAMPTTAGTGTEATKNAVISSYDPPFKKSLRSELMMPRVVLVDPELAVSLSPEVTAHTGMDAITQLVESYISRRARPIPSALCLQGLELAIPAIVRAVEDGSSRAAREKMAHAALLSGMALANSGLGMAHGVAAALGVHCRVPHGLACAVMLPTALRVNRDAAKRQLALLAPPVTGRTWPSEDAAVDAVIDRIEEIGTRIGIPARLSEIGVEAGQLQDIVAGSRGNSMNGNPRELSDDELHGILEAIL